MSTIRASSGDVTEHIERLWGEKLKDVALDAGRDPTDSNVEIVRIVTELRLAQETRGLRIATAAAAIAAALAALAATASAIVAGIAA